MEHIGDPVHIITTRNLWYRGTVIKVRFGGRLILSETAEHAVPPVSIEPPTLRSGVRRATVAPQSPTMA